MWFNPMVKWLLRSPLHGIMSGNTVVLHYQGRKSGRAYSLPVNYVQSGQTLYLISSPDRTWWRNLRDGAQVQLELRRQVRQGWGEVLSGEAATNGLTELVKAAPGFARYLKIRMDKDGRPDQQDIIAAARERVILRVQLEPIKD